MLFSKRISLQGKPKYRIKGADYTAIKEATGEFDNISNIATKYCDSDSTNVSELLYDLLLGDKNVHDLCSILSKECKDFLLVQNEMQEHVSQGELTALIDLVNTAEKDGIGLFDLKYHSFVRPLSGAYITCGEVPRLSLTKANEIDGMKAFEIGNCRFCNSPYIIGKIQKNEQDQLNYLLQNKEVDIYENYGSEDFVQIDYFLLENAVIEDDEGEIDESSVETYEVCAKCGEIHAADNLNAKKCGCNEDYYFRTYRVLQSKKKDEDSIYNNITQCPCCGHKAQAGVVKALNIGKDEGTALIAQILYEAIDEGTEQVKRTRKLSLKPVSKIPIDASEEKVKQFLAFSDSRQQASFAAIFFENNHVRMLRKRLIWEMIKYNNYAEMNVDALAAYLEERIKTADLFHNDMSAHKNAWAAVLVDLLKIDGSYDGEGLGLYYFDLDVKHLINEFTDNEIEEAFFGCNMTKEKLYTFIQLAFNVFKTAPAISYVKSSTLTPDERRDILEFRRFNNYVMLKNPIRIRKSNSEDSTFRGVRSFLPARDGQTNAVVRYTMKAFDIVADTAKDALKLFFLTRTDK